MTAEINRPGDVPNHSTGAFSGSNAETQPMRPARVVSPNSVTERAGQVPEIPRIRRSRGEVSAFVPSPQILDGLSESTAIDRAALDPWDTAVDRANSSDAKGTRAALAAVPDYTDHITRVVDAQRENASAFGENPVHRDTAVKVLATHHPDAPALDAFAGEARSLAGSDVSDRDVAILTGAMHEEVVAITVPVAEQRKGIRSQAEADADDTVPTLPVEIPEELRDRLGIDPNTNVDPRYTDIIAEALDTMRDPDATEEEVRFALAVPTYGEYLEDGDEEVDAGAAALVPPAEELDRIGESVASFASLDDPSSKNAVGVTKQLFFRAIGIAHGKEAEWQARREDTQSSTADASTAASVSPTGRRVKVHIGGSWRDPDAIDFDDLVPRPPMPTSGRIALQKAIARMPENGWDLVDRTVTEVYDDFHDAGPLSRGEIVIPSASSASTSVFDAQVNDHGARRETVMKKEPELLSSSKDESGPKEVNPFPSEPAPLGARRRRVIRRLGGKSGEDSSVAEE